MEKKKIGIIGAGKVGTALGYLLKQKGYQVIGISSRDWEQTELAQKVNCFFLTTPDGAIAKVAEELVRKGGVEEGDFLIHMSGALPAEIMSSAKEKGAYIFSLHPLQTFADVEVAVQNLPGSFFAGQGDEEVLPLVKKIVEDLDGEFSIITKEAKALYHAGACVACNYLVSLIDITLKMYEKIGISREKASRALIPLIKGTVANLENLGVPQALTGPIARGDGETIKRHLESLEFLAPELKGLYSLLGGYTTEVGLDKGTLGQEQAQEIKEILEKGMINNG